MLYFAVALGFVIAYPFAFLANPYMIARGKGHAVVHESVAIVAMMILIMAGGAVPSPGGRKRHSRRVIADGLTRLVSKLGTEANDN